MRRRVGILLAIGWLQCGGGSGAPDGSTDATSDVNEVDVYEASVVDVPIDVPPERAIWVATATRLFKLDPNTHVISRVADFDCSGEPMIDLAMNADEELFGITSESVVRIDKTTGECFVVARGALDLPYATSFVPAGSLEAGAETWLGFKYSTYSSINPDSGALTFQGSIGYQVVQASGDMVTVPGGKTYVTALSLDPTTGDLLAEMDPNTGLATTIDTATGAPGLVGMAQWAGVLYMFSVDGTAYRALLLDGGALVQPYTLLVDWGDAGPTDAGADGDADASAAPLTPSWRGAAVTTRAPGP